MKWVKFLTDYDGHKAGEIVSLDEAEAKILVKAKQAEETTEPKEVTEKAANIDAIKKEMAKDIAAAVLPDLLTELKTLAKSDKSKRPDINVGEPNVLSDPQFGFKNLNEQVRAVKAWCQGDAEARKDERMKALEGISTKAPTTYVNEGTGPDGGFIIAPTFSNKILTHAFDDEALLPRTDTYTTGSNNLTIPKDETTPWGTSGVQVYWASEAQQLTQSKLKLGQDNLQLNKLTALVPVTDEQLQDSFTGLGDYVMRQGGERIRWATDDAIVNGGGVGKPLGFFNSSALVSQAEVSAQTAATINITNIASMISRIPNLNPANCIWMVHPSAFPQLVILTNGNQSLYIAAGAVANANPRLGTLFGIPVLVSQHCPSALGTQGDIFLVDLKKYITLTKGDGIQAAMSIHLYFDYNVSTFRLNFRVAGQPWLANPITSAYGSYTQSPFVTLDTRS